MANEFDLIDSIAERKDIDALYRLQNNAVFSITVYQILNRMHDENPVQLNDHQLTLFLCMHLENAGQSSNILSCLEDWFPQYLDKFVPSLRKIDAMKCADVIEKAISLLSIEKGRFFDYADEAMKDALTEYDRIFSNYPDGNMPSRYRDYAVRNQEAITEWT